jgi:hypothetical protein
MARPATARLASVLDSRGKIIFDLREADGDGILDLVKRVQRERTLLLNYFDAYQLVGAVIRTAKIPGDLIEVGVFQGGSARLICEFKRGKVLHLCDTFEGLPAPTGGDAGFAKGQFRCGLDRVRDYLAEFRGLEFHQGFFPNSAACLSETTFSFANLDVDLYESTKGSLEFLYPRMAKGGVILSHDYRTAAGVRQAFDEFFAEKPEPVLALLSSQCLVVKV